MRGILLRSALGLAASLLVLTVATPTFAQATLEGDAQGFSGRKIFFMLFLMLGPIKILAPFTKMTHNCDSGFRYRLATRAILFSAAALAIAGSLGRSMLDNFNISLPVLALTGGVILFLVALRTILEQSIVHADPASEESISEPKLELAFSPLAFPIIVTPYGIAAVIIFATVATDTAARLTLAAIVLGILVLDLLAMIFADIVLKWIGTALQVFAVVLSITQVALGLQIIAQNLGTIVISIAAH